jgi:hypothetical protein
MPPHPGVLGVVSKSLKAKRLQAGKATHRKEGEKDSEKHPYRKEEQEKHS